MIDFRKGTATNDEPPGLRIRERNRTLDWDGINSENLRKLKQARGHKKGQVTKAQDEIRELMTDRLNLSLVKDKLVQLNNLYEEFARAHTAHHNQLKDECDIDESNEYHNAVEQSKMQVAGAIARWIIPPEISELNLPSEVCEVPDDVTPIDSISNIGSRPGTKFSRRSRGSNASSVSSARAKAAAKRAVLEAEAANLESFQAIQKEELTLQQRKKRKKAFELTTEIAKAEAEEQAYAKAEAGSGIKFQTPSNSAKEMKPSDNRTPHPVEDKIPFSWNNQQRLATASSGVDSLTGCKNMLKEIGYLSKVENSDTLKVIVNRLPFGLRLKWRDVADNITELLQYGI